MLINILLLVLGTFMDLAPMLLICTPILLPVILKFGIDPVHFGMIMLLNLGIGLVTPPVGPTMVVGCAIGRVTMEQITKHLVAVLRGDADRAAAGHLHPRDLAVAAEPLRPLRPVGLDGPAGNVRALSGETKTTRSSRPSFNHTKLGRTP